MNVINFKKLIRPEDSETKSIIECDILMSDDCFGNWLTCAGLLFRFGTTQICFSKFFAKPNEQTSSLLAR